MRAFIVILVLLTLAGCGGHSVSGVGPDGSGQIEPSSK